MSDQIERVTDIVSEHGEGPCWDERTERLLWVDGFAGSYLSTDVDTGETERIEVAGPVAACLRPTATGTGVVVAGEREIQLIDGGRSETILSVPLAEGIRFNDGGCDRQGRIYIGTFAWPALTPGVGDIWRIGADSEPCVVASEMSLSNGIGWSPDESLTYFVDSETNRIDVFDFEAAEGNLKARRPFAVIPEDDGIPDGLCVDVDGGVWVALWGTGTIRRYAPDGSISADLKVDCPPVTSCAFGGPGMETLFITTSRFEDPHREPPAGSLFACTPGVAGLPVEPFALGSAAVA